MKITIENGVEYETFRLVELYGAIINMIAKCTDREDLRQTVALGFMECEEVKDYFSCGFGDSYFWVGEKPTGKRLIFVELCE